jgi:hypothetical protein
MTRSLCGSTDDSTTVRRWPRLGAPLRVLRATWCWALIIGLLGQGVAYGQAWGVVQDLPGTRSDSLRRPDVAVDAAGNAMAVWWRGAPDVISAARYDAASGVWNQPVDLALNVRPELFPVVAGDDLGNVVAAWTTNRGANNLVQVARYSAAAGTWSAAQTIAQAGASGIVSNVAIAGNASGDAVLVWSRELLAGWTVQSARYTAATGTWSSPVDVSATNGGGIARVAVNAAGNAMAVWTAAGPSSKFARYTAASGTWTSATDFGSMSFGDGRFKLDGSGNAMMVWIEQVSNPNGSVVKAIRYAASSATWGAPVIVSPDGQWCNRPDLTMDAAGNAVAIFEYEDFPAQTGRRGIHATQYTVASGAWAGVDVVRDAYWHTGARITVDASGNLTAAWHVPSPAPVGILAARRPAGGAWEAPVVLRRRFTQWDSPSLAPTLPVDQVGNVMLVWSFFDSPAAGSSLESTQWLAHGTATGPPGAPTNFAATVTGSTLSLTWSAPTTGAAPTDYALLGRLSAGGPLLATVPMGPGTSFSGAAPNGTFVLSVRASNASGTGPESATVTVTVPQAPAPPGAPSGLTASTTGSTVSFSWTPPSSGGAVANYVLIAGTALAFSVPDVTVPLGPTPAVVVPGVPPGTFYVRVLAQNAAGTSAASNEVTVTVAGATPPGAPTLHQPIVTGSTVALSWSAGAGETATHYTLVVSLAPDGLPLVTVPLAGTAISFSGVPAGTYYLRLTATNAAGTSPLSPQVTLIVP